MIFNKNELIKYLKNCYRKLKSYIHFSNNLEYVKVDIVEFEYDHTKFEKAFDALADALINEDNNYFDALIKQTKVRVFAKSFKDNNEEAYVISNTKNEDIVVSKVNFFINVPVELLIIDTFWSILYGRVLDSSYDYERFCYANKIHHDLYRKVNSANPLKFINFKSLCLFEQYYPQYTKWKNDAINAAKSCHSKDFLNVDVSIVCFDFSKYYYSINIDFGKIKKQMNGSSPSLSSFDYLTKLIEKLYSNYSALLRQYDRSIGDKQIIAPIGLISSALITNGYLLDFDSSIEANPNVISYGRYVDDVLIVLKDIGFDSFKELVNKHFSKQFEIKDNKFYLKGFDKVSIQKEKTKIIKIDKKGSANILNKLMVDIHPSEPRLFPSYQIDIKDFLNDITTKDEIIKVRDTNANTINVKKLVSAINGYINIRKCTIEDTTKRKTRKETVEEEELESLLELLSPKSLLTIYTRWNKLFLFAYLHNKGEEIANRLKANIRLGLKKMSFNLENAADYDSDVLLQLVKNEYHQMVQIAEASYKALVGVKSITAKVNKLAIQFRNANMIDYNAIAIPMSNYLDNLPSSYSLIGNTDYREIIKITSGVFDDHLMYYSPRFINLGDFIYFKQMINLYHNTDVLFSNEDLVNYYQLINNIFGVSKNPITVKQDQSSKGTYGRLDFTIDDSHSLKTWYEKGIYIGMANINLSRHKIIKEGKKKTLDLTNIYSPRYKKDLIDLLNECHVTQTTYYYVYDIKKRKTKKKLAFIETTKTPVSFLVFPETYLPINWIPTLIKYAKNSGAVVVSGIKYIDINNQILNLQVVIIPFTTSSYHRQALVVLREKNNYAPFEKEIITNSCKTFVDHAKPIYYTFNHRGISFSTFICYELTDILARAMVRNRSEIVFSSEYNRDIHYFSNIVESTSRDLSAFVVQVNSSECGDTRIIAPYRDKYKNIASITGGEKNSVHIGKIDLEQQRLYMKEFKSHASDCEYSKLDKEDRFAKNKKPSAGTR